MALCPKCSGEMGLKQAVCPHCGYDFPLPPEPPDRTWQVLLIGGFVLLLSVWGLWDNPVVAVACGACEALVVLGVVFKLWRLIRD